MSRAPFALLLVCRLSAQVPSNPFDKAPPDVEDALRDRITKFYQAHVDRKFRQADQYVAEDTKDFYYEANKPAYLAFEIKSISYSDNFTKAKAIVACKLRVPIPDFTEPVMIPTPSTWKLENGQWFWYVDQSQGRETPFGRMKPATEVPAGSGVLPSLSSGPNIQALWNNVRADKNLVQLKASQESSGEVTISSKMPGNVTLRLDYSKTPGLEVSLDRNELKSGEQAKVSFRQMPQKNASAKTTEVRVFVEPTNQMIPIRVEIQ